MKVLKHKLTFQLSLGRKGAIVDVDLIISYLLFMGLLIAVVQFTLSLVTVFSNDFRILSREKNILSASELISTNFNAANIDDLCNELNYSNVRIKNIEYDLLGFFMPKKDSDYTMPNLVGTAQVLFLRNNDFLHLIIGSGSVSETKVTTYLSMNYDTSAVNISLESGENLSTYYDSHGLLVIKLESVVSNGDLDEVKIGPISERTLIIPEVYNVTLSDVHVGSLEFNNNCGRMAIKGPQSSFTRYGTINHDSELYPVKIKGDVWWTG